MPATAPRALRRVSPSTLFRSIQIRRPEQMYSLLYNFPSLRELGLDLPKLSNQAIRASSRSFQSVASDLADSPSGRPAFGARYPVGAPAQPGFQVPVPEDDDKPGLGKSGEELSRNESEQERIGVDIAGWPVRDQGDRGTCVAHAMVACREHLAFEQGEDCKRFDLSEQFLFWGTKTQGGDPSPHEDGTWIEFAKEALMQVGVCREELWPYDGLVRGGNVTHAGPGLPTGSAQSGAVPFCHPCSEYAREGGAARVLEHLTRTRRPVAISLPVFRDRLVPLNTNWNTPVGIAYGEVLDPPPTAVAENGHAVCVVGFVPDGEELHGGYFVFRNSWGTMKFGRRAPVEGWYAPAPGYGQISASYVDNYLWELCVL